MSKPNLSIELPTNIIFPGFLADTALFDAAWAALFSLIPLTRRYRRARKGLCLRCAYNRAGLTPAAPCPECGTLPRPANIPAA